MSSFLQMTQNLNKSSKDQILKMFQALEENIENINNPVSITALLHKIQLFTLFNKKGLESKILDRSIQIFENDYNFSDTGNLLKTVLLVVSLQKIRHDNFYDRIFVLINNNIDKIGYFNLITMLESYTYNKMLLKATGNEKVLRMLNKLNNLTNVEEAQYISKVINVYTFINKMKPMIKDNDFVENFEKVFDEIINKIYKILFEVIMINKQNNFTSKSFNIMNITDILLSLDTIQINQDIQIKHKKLVSYYNDMINIILPKDFIIDKINYQLDQVMIFVKKYHVSPPANLNEQISILVNKVFIKHMNHEISQYLENCVYTLLFLTKTNQLKLSSEMITNITNKLVQCTEKEKNILKLSKVLEYCSFIHSSGNKAYIQSAEEIYRQLEPKLFDYLMKLNNIAVANPIIQIFQHLVQMNKGNPEHWKFLFDIFSSKNTLRRLDNKDLIVTLIPAAAVKTRNLFKMYNNVTSYGANMHYLKQIQIDPELTEKIEKFWLSIEDVILEKLNDIYPEKYPVILFHLVYANITKQKITRVFVAVKDKILKNLTIYDGKNLCKIVYSYARVKERADDLLFAISERLKKQDTLLKSMSDSEAVNLLWGYANLRIYDKELFDLIINRLFNNFKSLGNESFTELCQALAILNYELSKEHLCMIVNHFNSQLDNFSKLHSQNKEHGIDSQNEQKTLSISSIIVITHSLIVIDDFKSKNLWDKLVEILIMNRKLWETNPSFLYNVYLMYFHAQAQREKTEIRYSKELYDVLYQNYKRIIDYLKINKKQNISISEQKCKKIIIENAKNILPLKSEGNPEICELKMNNSPHEIMYISNYQKIEEIQKTSKTFLKKGVLVFPYTIDALLDPYAFEINGPWHYHVDNQNQFYGNGYDEIKKKIIEKSGLKYIEIPYTVNDEKDEALTSNIIEILKKLK